ncbi:hypothetical protein [Pedobacter sp. MW01-1-1]|uniref:hypothetical protein n=1 Tax=Pedobacter sp. MW01-1-1 TaxID=3383027 RepID=UPI003FEE14AA
MINKQRICNLLFLLSIALNQAYGQKYDKNFKLSLVDLNFKMPKDFFEKDSTSVFKCYDRKGLTGSIIYLISNKDSSVVIAFVNVMRVNKTQYDPEENLRILFDRFKDPIIDSSKKYSSDYLLNNFNADIGGEYSRACSILFRQKYKDNRFVVIGKKNVGEATMIYFYNKETTDIDAVIKETKGILKFK